MSRSLALGALDEAGLARLAELVALKVARGDVIALDGDLGAGKTTFARALIRALLGDADAEVPSPTFSLVQPYATPRLAVFHFDLYRLAGPGELAEIGFEAALADGLAVIEWPERGEGCIPDDRLDIALRPDASDTQRAVTLTGHGSWAPRLARLGEIHTFIADLEPGSPVTRICYLQGDASARAYARIEAGGTSLVLMDSPPMADGPPVARGLPYSRIAHLAEDVRPFVAVARTLEAAGLSVPHLHKVALDQGLLLLEDLGDLTFGRALALGHPQATLWSAAVDVLIGLRRAPPPRDLAVGDGTVWRLPRFDRAALEIELALILDWYWPEVKGGPAPDDVRREMLALWSPVLDRLLAAPAGLFLRDFHSPNLFWLPDRAPGRTVGVIDFQDALAEPWALDLVSLLQDARVDVPEAIEQHECRRYVEAVAAFEPGFPEASFRATYAAFGAQRNTRLIGLWVRLLRRDGKPAYLQHMARTWGYLERNLRHPDLAPLAAWYDRHFPEALRRGRIEP